MGNDADDERGPAAIAAYGEVRAALIEALAPVDDATAAATTVPATPDWSVTDAMAHVAGVCIDIVDGNLDGVGTPAWADGHVARHAHLGLATLLERWADTAAAIDGLGPYIPGRAATQFCFDGATHAHDVRGALGLPGDREGAGVLVGLDFLAGALDRLVEARGLAPLVLESPAWRHGPEEPDAAAVRLEAPTFELFRAFGGRRSLDQIRAMDWSADPAPYLAVFEGSPLVPPTAPLVE